MVIDRTNIKGLITALFMMLITLETKAASTLEVTVDRNQIYETDTLNMQVVGQFDMELSFGGILNFGRNQMGSPDVSKLEENFEILDQQQNYNMQSINGKTTSQVTWNYTLAPRQSGSLEIPAIEYKGTKSRPLNITVLAGNAPRNVDNPPPVFLEVEVDKDSVYVQEQVIYTMRLYSADHLASGDWSAPTPLDAIVESLGETKKYFRMAYNQRYEVREKQFLVFPQKSGTLEVEAQNFSGILIDTRSRRRVRVRERSEPVEIQVKAPPAEFSGDLWLPAASLELRESWSDQANQAPEKIQIGDSVTRSLEIQALGLLGSALPPIPHAEITGLKIYPDQAEVESFEHEAGVQSSRKETTALVAVQTGQTTLPEVRVPWWDTVNDVERVAVIPSRTLTIETTPASQTGAFTPPVQPPIPNAEHARAPMTDVPAAPQKIDVPGQGLAPSALSPTMNHQPWVIVIFLLLLGWGSTSWWFWRKLNQNAQDNAQPAPQQTNLKALLKAIDEGSAQFPILLIEWAQDTFPAQNIKQLNDLHKISSSLQAEALAFEASRYGKQAGEVDFDGKKIIAELKALQKTRVKVDNGAQEVLMPYYP